MKKKSYQKPILKKQGNVNKLTLGQGSLTNDGGAQSNNPNPGRRSVGNIFY